MPVDYDLGTARGRIEIDSSQLGRAHQSLRTFGLAFTAAGIAAAAGFALVVKSAADFEREMDAVKAVSGASRQEMALLSEQALDLSTRTVFSANEIAGAMQALAKAGIPVQDMLDGATQATINLAAAAGDELPGGVERAAEIISNAQKVFNASADELEHFADSLVGAAASSTLSVEDLAVSMRYAGPIAAALGFSIDDLNTTLAILGDRGIRGSTAGTSLRGVLLSLSPTSAKARDALRDLGIITEDGANKFFDLEGNMKSIPEVMQILQDATKGLSEEQKVQAFNTIFQRRAMNAAMILAEQGADGFLEYAEAIGAIDASDVAAEKLDNLSGDITILKNNIDTLIKRAGLPLQEMFRKVVQRVTDFVQKLNEIDPQILATAAAILGIVGVLLTLVGLAALFGSALVKMYSVFILVKEAVGLLATAFKLLSISLLTNPVFLIIAAIVALGAAIWLAYQRSEVFREAWNRLFEDLRPIFQAIGRFVSNFVEQLGNLWDVFREGDDVAQGAAEVIDNMFGNTGALVDPIRTLVNFLIKLKNAAVAAFDYFADVVLPLMIDVGYAIVNGIQVAIDWLVNTGIPAIQRFGSSVADVARSIASWFNEHVMPVIRELGALIVAVVDIIVAAWDFMWPITKARFDAMIIIVKAAAAIIWAIIKSFVATVKILWNNFGDIIVDTIVVAWNFIKGIVEAALQSLKGIIQIITGIITGDWSKVWEGIKNFFGGTWNSIKTILSTALDVILLVVRTTLAIIKTIWDLAWRAIELVIKVVWIAIQAVFKAGWTVIKGIFTAGLNFLKTLWNTVWGAIKTAVLGAWNFIKTTVSNGVNAVVTFLTGLPGRALTAISNLVTNLKTKASEAMTSMKTAISNGITTLIETVKTIPTRVVDALGELGNTLLQAGKDLIGGLVDGISDAIPDVEDVLGGITDSLTSWKGPPEKDKKILIPSGEMIIQGFKEGILNEVKSLQKLLESIAPSIPGALGSGPFSPGGGANAPVTLQFVFPNVTSAKDIEEIEAALSDSDVLSQIIHATRAGVGNK